MVSGSINGEIVIWNLEFKTFPNQSSECKLIFKEKLVIHHDRINNITINTDLRVAVVSCRDGYLSIIDVIKC